MTSRKMDYFNRLDEEVRTQIIRNLAAHVVTELHSYGLYRHWRCQQPNTRNMGFDIVTWPGSLCYTGDMGDYLFERTADMVAFMRGSCMSYSYAAEKCVAHDGRLKEWRSEIFEEVLADRIKCQDEDADSKRKAEVMNKIDEIRREYGIYETEHDAMRAIYESGIWNCCDLPNCTTYSRHFLWCLHAIKWFCAKIDAGEVVKSRPEKAEATA